MASLSGAGSGVLLSTNTLSSLHTVDILIFIAFLVFNLILGLAYSKKSQNMQEYAIGNKDFSTPTLTATVVVSWIGGSYLFAMLGQVYQDGLYFGFVMLGAALCLFLAGQVAIRMGSFQHNVSIAEALGTLYGKKVRIVAAISGILSVIAVVAIEFQVMGKTVSFIFGVEGLGVTLASASIVIFYSLSGGIRAVTFTDVFQFLTFCIFMPVIALVVWNQLQDPQQVVQLFHTHPNFNPQKVLSWTPKLRDALIMFVWFAIPAMDPVVFQRISMARSVRQAKRSFSYASIISFLAILLLIWLAILLRANDPTLDPSKLVGHIVQNYAYIGLKGLIGVGVMAISMSTADSYLNASSVLFANDILKPLGMSVKYDVRAAQLFCGVLGVLALLLVLYANSIIELLELSNSFYMPVVTVPFLMAVWGFRTSNKGALLSMGAGFSTVVLWSIFFSNRDSILPGIVANLLVLLGSHYFLGEPGGWQKVAPDSPLGLERAARREAWERRIQAIKGFKLYPYLQQNLPSHEGLYSIFGLYAILATYSALYVIAPADAKAYGNIYEGIVHTGLFVTTGLLTFPIWPPVMKNYRLMAFLWPLGIGGLLFFGGTLIVIMSHFHPIQMMVLMINFLIAVLLLQWSLALLLAVSGASLAMLFFQNYTGETLPWSELGSSQFMLLYGLLLFTSLLIALLKGKQAFAQLGKKNEALQNREKDHQANLVQVSAEKQAALASFQHTGAEQLLAITRKLQHMHVAEEDKEEMTALQKELLPIAFHLQGIDTRAQDYLRLNKTKLALKSWCDQIKEAAAQKGVTLDIHCRHDAKVEEIKCDIARLTSLLVKSMVALSTQAEGLEDKPTIFFRLEDTQLSYSLPDVKSGYIKYVPAVRIALTVGDDLPLVKASYSPDLHGSSALNPAQGRAQFVDSRIIKSHYGYAELTDDTFIYVVPVDVEDVRPKDMDKDYMEVGAKPIRADDHFKNDEGIDAQVQEAAFLTDVAARSDADLGMVRMALETIKWYHGPKGRHSGEPFYLHPLTVAHIVLDYNQDQSTLIGALLHDTVEDTPMQLEHIEAMFGKETAKVVDVVTHLQSIEGSIYKIKMSASENLQMLDRTDRTKGLYVKLADRMHNMRTIGSHNNPKRRQEIAQETASFFVPLARKLGLHQAAAEFDKMCYEVFKQKD